MFQSMTGFGKGEASEGEIHYEVNCKSVNNRFLETAFRLPVALWSRENEAKKIFSKNLSRGKVDIFWKDLGAKAGEKELTADLELARSYQKAYLAVATGLGLEETLRTDTVARFPEVIGVAKQEMDSEVVADKHWAVLKMAMQEAVASLVAARVREGESLKEEFNTQLDAAEELVRAIETGSDAVKEAFQEKIGKRLHRLLDKMEPDDPRLVMETAMLCDKADIREEVVRFRTHVGEFRRLLAADQPTGKRLDFLSQELLREANTMGSKSPDAGLSHKVVELKAVVEKIKEQILNVE